MRQQLPVAIIGGGPVGLAAAAHLVERQLPFVVLESGPRVGHSVLRWGHVQLFSPWRYVQDAAAVRLLSTTAWTAPDPEAFPTGQALVEDYLAPLATHPAIAPHIRLGSRVTAVSRAGFDKLKTSGRERAPFQLSIVQPDGQEQLLLARAVIDASGTYATPNPLGTNGLPAVGELALSERIVYGIPDVLGTQRARYRGRRVLVAGSGHSAFNALLDLATLAEQEPGTQITWVMRRGELGQAFGGGENDALPARGRLGQRVQTLLEHGTVRLVTGWRTDRLAHTPEGVVAYAGDQALPPVDEIIVATGLRPDLTPLRELRLGLDPIVEAPIALAPLIDPNLHSCGTVPPHGVDELAHPEPGFYMIGMKSYGRAPTFLLLTGYEQARSVVAALAGDWQAARTVELVLPETGVCSGPASAGDAGRDAVIPLTVASSSIDVGAGPIAGLSTAIPLTLVEGSSAATSCCAVEQQASCCEPAAKESCCGSVATTGSCGCQ